MMCVQIIHDNIYALGFWVNHIHQIAHGKSKILFGAMPGYQHMPRARFGFDK